MITNWISWICYFQCLFIQFSKNKFSNAHINKWTFKTELQNVKIQIKICIPILSLERRWSSRTFRYGYLVTTSPQSSVPPSAAGSINGYPTDFGCYKLSWCDGRCVQGPGTYSPWHADPRLLAIPASCRRVAAYNPNWERFYRISSPSRVGNRLYRPL